MGDAVAVSSTETDLSVAANGAIRPFTVGFPQEAVDDLGCELERQTLVAARVVVRAHELVARPADQHRARDQLERRTAGAIPEAPGADVPERPAAVVLDERHVAGPGVATVVGRGNRTRHELADHGHAGASRHPDPGR